jgi:hypothetical protein
MKFARNSLIPALFGLVVLPVVAASADDQHHQPDDATAAPSLAMPAVQPAATPSVQMMMPMMGMMGPGGMPMMGMMGPGAMPMWDIGEHLEGRIAFLRAELGITETQAPKWGVFVQALRDSASKLKQVQAAAMQPAAGSIGYLQRAELQEQWLGARLEAVKAVKTAFAGLRAVLSEEQKKTAEALLAQPVCLGQMGMI